MEMTKSFVVRAPVDTVYAYLSDPRNAIPPSAEGTLTVDRVAGGDGERTQRYRATISTPSGLSGSYDVLVDDLEPPRHIAATVVGLVSGATDIGATRITYDLASIPEGTRVVSRTELHAGFFNTALLYLARITGQLGRMTESTDEAMAQEIERWAATRRSPDQDQQR